MDVAVGEKDKNGFLLVKSNLEFDLWRSPKGKYSIEKSDGTILHKRLKEKKEARRLFRELSSDKTTRILDWGEMPRNGMISFYGFRGSGKTANVWWLAEKLHNEQKREVTAVLPERVISRTVFPDWVNIVDNTDQIKGCKGHIVIGDEMSLQANSREFRSDSNKFWVRLAAIIRQLDILMLSAAQHTRQVDVQMVMDVDWLVFKKPSQLHLRMVRGELEKEVNAAWEAFNRLNVRHPTADPRSWSYAADIHNGRVGWLENGLPSFWSENVSNYFANAYIKMTGEMYAR